jgi:hypothetical protein
VVVVHVLIAVAFTTLLPAFRGPDEATHVDMIRRYRAELGHGRPDRLVPMGEDVRLAQEHVAPTAVLPRPPQLTHDATPRPRRPAFSDLAAPGTPSIEDNHMTQHPPLFYALTAGASSFLAGLTPEGWWSWDREVLLYRLMGIALIAALPLLAAEAALAVGLSRRASSVVAATLMLIPQWTAISAGVNNDALVVLGTGGAVAAALWHLRTGTVRSAVVAAAAGSAAALAKATAAPTLAWVVLVVLVTWWSRRPASAARAPLLGAGAAAAVGFSWYGRNLIRFKDPQPTGLAALRPPADFEPTRWTFLHQWLDRLSRTFWGMPARRTGVALPWWMPHLLSLSAVLLCVASLWDRLRRRVVLLLWALCAAQVGLLLRSNWASHSRSGALPAVQGRYLFTLLVPVAVLAVLGARQLLRRLPWPLPRVRSDLVAVALTTLGAGLHLLLAISMLEGFWGAADASTWERLVAVRAWSPLPAPLTMALLATLVALPLLGVAVLSTAAVRARRARTALRRAT